MFGNRVYESTTVDERRMNAEHLRLAGGEQPVEAFGSCLPVEQRPVDAPSSIGRLVMLLLPEFWSMCIARRITSTKWRLQNATCPFLGP